MPENLTPPPPPLPSSHFPLLPVLIFSTLSLFLGLTLGKYLFSAPITPTPLSGVTGTLSVPTPTPAWKTYSGTNFSFQYPADWTIQSSQIDSTRTMQLFIPSNFTLIEGSQNYAEAIAQQDQAAPSKEPITIAGTNTFKYSHKIGESTSEALVVLQSPSGQLLWLAMPIPAGSDTAIFDRILSTFKFTSTASQWPTYSNSDFGLSLSYPTDFKVLTASTSKGELPDLPTTIFSIEKDATFPSSHLTTRHILLIEYIPNIHNQIICNNQSGLGFNSTPTSHLKTINGQKYYFNDPYGGAGAGTHDTNVDYTTFANNHCLHAKLSYYESSDWNDPNDTVLAKTDQAAAFSEFDKILSTIKFTN